MLNEEIADMLAEYRRAKNDAKELREEMIRFAVEELGLEQKEATQMDIYTFLDGYLVGKGIKQSWRNVTTSNVATSTT